MLFICPQNVMLPFSIIQIRQLLTFTPVGVWWPGALFKKHIRKNLLVRPAIHTSSTTLVVFLKGKATKLHVIYLYLNSLKQYHLQ